MGIHQRGKSKLTDKTMSNQVQRFERVQAECLALYKVKNERYGNSFELTLDSWGLTPIGIRLEDKLNRLRELIKRPDLETADESLRDTLVDIANYATMAVSYLDREGESLQAYINEVKS